MLTRAQLDAILEALPSTPGVILVRAFHARLSDGALAELILHRLEGMSDEERARVGDRYAEIMGGAESDGAAA